MTDVPFAASAATPALNLSAGHIITGWLGLLLAVPPGYGTAAGAARF
jgi:hypothetical protein